MRNVGIVILFTIREMLAQKIVLTIFIFSVLTLIGFSIAFSLIPMAEFTSVKEFVEIINKDLIIKAARQVEMQFINMLYGIGLFLAIFTTAKLIPDLLKKGHIDLFISRPISRIQLIIGRYIGGWIVVFVNICFMVLGLWVITGLKFDFWDYNFLYAIPLIVYTFTILFALIFLLSVITNSSMVPMIISYIIFIVLSPILINRENIIEMADSKFWEGLLEVLYYILPQTADFLAIANKLIKAENDISFIPVLTSGLLFVIYLSSAIYLFKKKDF